MRRGPSRVRRNPFQPSEPEEHGWRKGGESHSVWWKRQGMDAVRDLMRMGAKIPLPLYVAIEEYVEKHPENAYGVVPQVDLSAEFSTFPSRAVRAKYSIWIAEPWKNMPKAVGERLIRAGLRSEHGGEIGKPEEAYVHHGVIE